ncbi:hypothetical protein FRC03_012641 [Tulasnella sp. 419]|nr:hypothetical protein FRC03_012641 [Tulasnella sp. 419]
MKNHILYPRKLPDASSPDPEVSENVTSDDWDDGSTLVDRFLFHQADIEKSSKEDNNIKLVEDLKRPMAAEAAKLQQELIETLVPAMDHIRLVHSHIDDTIETQFASAVVAFDRACDSVQESVASRKKELLEMLETSKNVLRHHFESLRAEYESRTMLWTELQTDIQAIASPTLDYFQDTALPQVEDVRASFDKKSKSLATNPKKRNNIQDMIKMIT